MKKFLKVAGLLVAGGIAGWIKGICDTAYYVGKGDVTKEKCERLTKAVDDLKGSFQSTTPVEETAEDITEMVSDTAEEVAEAVEEAASEVVPDITVTTNDSEEESDQPED